MPRVKSTFKIVRCKVCTVPTQNRIRAGALVCDACKKFFLRHYRQRGKFLHCITGSHNCDLNGTAHVGSSKGGHHLRGICASCRFEKCISVGMRILFDKRLASDISDDYWNQRLHRRPAYQDPEEVMNPVNTVVRSSSGATGPLLTASSSTAANELQLSSLEATEKRLLESLFICKDLPIFSNPSMTTYVFYQLLAAHQMRDIKARVQFLTVLATAILAFPV